MLVDSVKVSCNIKMRVIEDAVKIILDDQNISYKKFDGNNFVLFGIKKPDKKIFKAQIIGQNIFEKSIDHSYSEPKIISEEDPPYPFTALINKIEGKVRLRLLIDRDGKVAKTLVDFSSRSVILDSAAIKYASGLKFIPAKADGNPRNCWFEMTFLYSVIDSDR